MKTVIMAGGKGTRIRQIAQDIPKPLIPIEGKPVLERELECLRDQGFTEFILTLSHRSEQIREYFGTGEKLGVKITYYTEEIPLGNAGALLKLRNELTEDFLLLNADAVCDIDFQRFAEYHRQKGGLVTLFTHPNSHPYDSGLIIADTEGRVTEWLTKEDPRPGWYKNRVNAGIHLISPAVLDRCGIDAQKLGTADEEGKTREADLDRDLLKPLCGTGEMYCYDSPEYVKDMGTPERYYAVCRDYSSGLVAARNLHHKQKAVFLDRDGTINRYVGFLRKPEELELLPGAAEAVRLINEAGYLAILATNQPVIARGEVTVPGLETIHNKLETLLGKEGAWLDAIFYCPHHPDRGFPGEVVELKMNCSCRKPKPGLLLQAAEKYNIDLASSWMVGDWEKDIQCGKAAGCHTALVGEGSFGQDVTGDSLLSAVTQILKGADL